MNEHPIRWCVFDNDNGPICYCYDEEDAKNIVDGLNKIHNIDLEKEMDEIGFHRFAYEDMHDYLQDPYLVLNLIASFVQGFGG